MKKTHAIIIATLVVAIAAAASFRSLDVAAKLKQDPAKAALATLGNYPDTSVQLGANATITPDAAPTGATSITVSTSTNFHGELEADATTGVVRITNAHPALPLVTDFYTVTVTAFDNLSATTTKTFKLTVTTPAACNPVSFAAANNMATDDTPMSVAVGDFNRDGKQDLATANLNSDNVSLLLGDGTSNFSGAVGFGVGDQPFAIAIGDFNGDGNQDLAVANSGSANVSISLGDGLGGFGAANNFSVGVAPVSVAVGDFDGDGRADLVTSNQNSHDVSVLIGDGAGSFAAASNLAVSGSPNAVVVGDFDGDGKQDIANSSVATNNVSIFLGDGAGGFSAPTNFVAGSTPRALALGDFNHDGKQDLVTANQGPDNLSVLTGDGAGSFTVVTGFGVGLNPQAVSVGDFNGDGIQDVAVCNTGGSDISVLSGDGAGNFGNRTDFVVGTSPRSAAVGDFDSDGQEDLAVGNTSSANVSILLRQCPPPLGLAVINTNDSGAGSLRQAILDSNSTAGTTETIIFNIPNAGVHTISPLSALPQITDPVIIDGTTQPGYAGVPLIEVDGSGAGATTHGLVITAGASSVRGLIINRFDGNGIELDTNGGNTIAGNYIGTNATGTATAGNHANGIAVGGTSANHIGGTTAAARNVVSGNGAHGIALFGNSTGNLVRGNYVGTDVTGTAAVPNVGRGISVFDGTNNQIGGTIPGAGNVASGNGLDGIAIESTSAGTGGNNKIEGNFVGTNASGTSVLGNAAIGVLIVSAANCHVGGATSEARNIISGNNSNGVQIGGAGSFGIEISNNYIGTNAAGTAAIGNSQHGVLVNIDANAPQTVATIADDLISGNVGDGVRFVGSAGTSTKSPTPHPEGGIPGRNIRSTIGANATGTAALPNGGNGVSVINASNILVGGDTSADRNIISGNAGNGVMISGDDAAANTIQNNYIGTNAAGTAAIGNGQHGVLCNVPASPTGETLIADDLISGNVGDGVRFVGSAGTSTKSPTPHPEGGIAARNIRSTIGVNATGTAAIPNGGNGITILNASNILIGGDSSADRNVISGNVGHGVEISGASSAQNEISNNYIGTNAAGTGALGNQHGILVHVPAHATATVVDINHDLISGNRGDGIRFEGGGGNQTSGATGVQSTDFSRAVAAAKDPTKVGTLNAWTARPLVPLPGFIVVTRAGFCAIGTDAAGVPASTNGSIAANSTSAIPNGGNGISILDASNIQIGGASPGDGNTIAPTTTARGSSSLVTAPVTPSPATRSSRTPVVASTSAATDRLRTILATPTLAPRSRKTIPC